MSTPDAFPAELRELFPDQVVTARRLSVPLPSGRAVRGSEGGDEDEKAALWVSDGPGTAALWRSMRAEHQHSGLYPLALESFDRDARRPWDDGELWPNDMTSPDDHDAGALLAEWWDSCTDPGDDGDDDALLAVTAPYGRQWPGLAAGKRLPIDPDEHAERCVEQLFQLKPQLRLGLVAATRGSDALTVAGWQGPVNHTNDTAELSAVLRTWENRFGVRVIGVGFDDLYLSVAAPPVDHAEALRVAAEHFAFCPDNVQQGTSPLAAYAHSLVDAPLWRFWWD